MPHYAGQKIAFLTQHGKEALVAPILDTVLCSEIVHVTGFDTDTLGSFSREIPRAGTQLEAARRKARIGMDIAGLPLGLASEGAFGPDPMFGQLPWNVELLLFIDDLRGIEVIAQVGQATRFAHILADDWTVARDFAEQAGFPEHGLVLRPDSQDDPRIRKGMADWPSLERGFLQAQAESQRSLVFLEHDLRAHAHPLRQQAIRGAAAQLAQKLDSLCPACGTPGFWRVESVPGRPCEACGSPTQAVRAEIWGCLKCAYREQRADNPGPVSAGQCDYCNP